MKEVTVYRTWDEPFAEMAAELLRAEGISVRKTCEGVRSVYPFTMDGLGEIELRVPADCADRAAEIIAVRFPENEPPENQE